MSGILDHMCIRLEPAIKLPGLLIPDSFARRYYMGWFGFDFNAKISKNVGIAKFF